MINKHPGPCEGAGSVKFCAGLEDMRDLVTKNIAENTAKHPVTTPIRDAINKDKCMLRAKVGPVC
jgi:hypothetical protein